MALLVTNPTTAKDSANEQNKMGKVTDANDQVVDRMPELLKLIGKPETKADGPTDK